MSLSIISFTPGGMALSRQIAREWDKEWNKEPVELYTKCSGDRPQEASYLIEYVEKSIGEWAKEQMSRKNTLLFIGACGIAVRAIAPHLTDKLHDSPVLVMDEAGRHVIPILSGHMGGANEIALRLGRMMGAEPVITTATDINHRFAVDLFAKENGLQIMNKDGIAKVSAKVLAGEELTMSVGEPQGPVDILIAPQRGDARALIWLRPKEYIIGMGCRRGKEPAEIEALIQQTLREQGISPEQIYALASIDVKKEEPGLLAWSRKYEVPFMTYTTEELMEVPGEFSASEFVKEQVGVDNVCERAARKACGQNGELIYGKHAVDGMTIAIAKCTKREWRTAFDEEY